MKKKFLSSILAISLMVSLLTGCSSSSSDTSSVASTSGSEKDADGETLTIWLPPFAGSDSDITDVEFWTEQLQPLVDETGCSLDIEIVPWDNYETKYLTGITSGDGPDVGYMYMEMFADYIDMGALTPLDDYFSEEEQDNYLYYDKGNFDGVQYALPIVVGNARILVANMDILNEAGVTEVPSTLDELVDVAQKIGSSNSDVIPFAQAWGDSAYGTLNEIFWPFFWGEGGSILNDDGNLDLDTDASIAAAQYLYDLKYKYNILSDSITSLDSDTALADFESGNVAMTMMQTSDAANLTDEGINWDFTPYLEGESGEGGTFVAADSLVLLNSCEDKDLAVKAMKLMTSASVMEAFHEEIYSAPSISKDETFEDLDAFKDLYTENAEHMHTLPVFAGSTTIYQTLFDNLQNMMLDDMTPEDVMENTMDYYETNVTE